MEFAIEELELRRCSLVDEITIYDGFVTHWIMNPNDNQGVQ